jgi:hypothetical protein
LPAGSRPGSTPRRRRAGRTALEDHARPAARSSYGSLILRLSEPQCSYQDLGRLTALCCAWLTSTDPICGDVTALTSRWCACCDGSRHRSDLLCICGDPGVAASAFGLDGFRSTAGSQPDRRSNGRTPAEGGCEGHPMAARRSPSEAAQAADRPENGRPGRLRAAGARRAPPAGWRSPAAHRRPRVMTCQGWRKDAACGGRDLCRLAREDDPLHGPVPGSRLAGAPSDG